MMFAKVVTVILASVLTVITARRLMREVERRQGPGEAAPAQYGHQAPPGSIHGHLLSR